MPQSDYFMPLQSERYFQSLVAKSQSESVSETEELLTQLPTSITTERTTGSLVVRDAWYHWGSNLGLIGFWVLIVAMVISMPQLLQDPERVQPAVVFAISVAPFCAGYYIHAELANSSTLHVTSDKIA